MINELVKQSHKNAVEHGWWENPPTIGDSLMLMVCELAETFEEYRDGCEPNDIYYNCKQSLDYFLKTCPEKNIGESCENSCGKGKPEGIPIELADTVIRIFDFCGAHKIDLEQAIKIKMEYNKTRPYKHGGKKI